MSRVIYTEDVNRCFEQLKEGNDNALKDYWDKCQAQLNNLSDLINGEMKKGDRKKTITLVTIDVHGALLSRTATYRPPARIAILIHAGVPDSESWVAAQRATW